MMREEQHKDLYFLKVSMHCQCNGCIKKINDGVNKITLSKGVERVDLVVAAAEVVVVGTMDPEKLWCSLHELTQKPVKIEAQTAVSEEDTAASKQTKNRVSQAPGTPRRQYWVTPSAPPLPEAWRHAPCAFEAMRVPLVGAFSRRVGCIRRRRDTGGV